MFVKGNIILLENEGFGNTNYDIVRSFLYMVDMNMMMALERPYFSTIRCIVTHTEDDPMCSKVGDKHFIFLNTKGDYWCQWVYQFAHEYCHHLINGSHTGEWSKLLWFEETICELSSLYNLHKMIGFCMEKDLKGYSCSVDNYLNNLLTKNSGIIELGVDDGWYKQYKEILQEKGYKRDVYNAIAVLIYPLFIHNPSLWKLILNIGDIRSWSSLEELFDNLQIKSDQSYSDSLRTLRTIFS